MSYKQQIAQIAEKLGVNEDTVTEISAIVEGAVTAGIQEREQELMEQVENAAREAAELVAETRIAMEAEVKAQVEEAAQLFVTENRERFVQTEQYDNMVQFVESIKEAFAVAGIGTDNLDKVAELQEQVEYLEQQLQESSSAADTATAAIMLRNMIAEHDLSFYQQERVTSLLQHTRPANLQEFERIAKNIIQEVQLQDDGNAFNDNAPVNEDRNTGVSDKMQRYLKAATGN